MKFKTIFLIGLVALIFWYWYDSRPVKYGHGIIAPEKPVQKPTKVKSFVHEGYVITPLAEFRLRTRVLSRKRYWMDRGSSLAPIDLAMGWGKMSDEKVLDELKISQRNRWFYWKCNRFPLPKNDIEQSSANMHMIPANDEIDSKIKAVKTGNLVTLKGFLVEVTNADGFTWKSSLSRYDKGDGACEVIYVKEFEIIDPEEVKKSLK